MENSHISIHLHPLEGAEIDHAVFEKQFKQVVQDTAISGSAPVVLHYWLPLETVVRVFALLQADRSLAHLTITSYSADIDMYGCQPGVPFREYGYGRFADIRSFLKGPEVL